MCGRAGAVYANRTALDRLRRVNGTSLFVTAAGVALALYTSSNGTLTYWMGGWTPHHELAIGIAFSIDPINAGLTAFVGLLVFCATMYTYSRFDLVGCLFHALLMAFLGSMVGYALTGDIFNMFVWFELMTAAAIALTAHKIGEAQSIAGAINLAVKIDRRIVGVLGIALLYARTGALNLAQIGEVLAQRPADSLVLVAFLL